MTVGSEYTGNRRKTTSTGIDSLHYGVFTVGIPAAIPADEKDDSLKLTVVTDHINILIKQINLELNPTTHSKDVLIYIHGFNTSFEEAVRTAAQLKYNLKFSGAVISYSWSSRGSALNYLSDGKAVQETIGCLADFIKICITEVKGGRLHILAHSMGNRALIGALKEMYEDKKWIEGDIGCPLTNVILAAADEEPKKFEEMVKVVKGAGVNIMPTFTVYCSNSDLALKTSCVINRRGDRLGQTTSFCNSEWRADDECVDVIDATNAGADLCDHSYFGDSALVRQDLSALIKDATRAQNRSCIEEVTYDQKIYYNFRVSM